MKKLTYILAMVACVFFLAINPSYATNHAQTGGEGTLTVTDAVGLTGGPMEFTPSPSTTISCSTDDNNYTICAGSPNNKADVGALYGIISSRSEVYRADLATDNTIPATTAVDALPTAGSTWEDKNGNTPPAP